VFPEPIGPCAVPLQQDISASAKGPDQGQVHGGIAVRLRGKRHSAAAVTLAALVGRQEDVTVGVNCYPDTGVRVMANWTRVVSLSPPYDRAYLNGTPPNIFLLRTQVDW
jgi:phosphate-selective porin OprO and OprP